MEKRSFLFLNLDRGSRLLPAPTTTDSDRAVGRGSGQLSPKTGELGDHSWVHDLPGGVSWWSGSLLML